VGSLSSHGEILFGWYGVSQNGVNALIVRILFLVSPMFIPILHIEILLSSLRTCSTIAWNPVSVVPGVYKFPIREKHLS